MKKISTEILIQANFVNHTNYYSEMVVEVYEYIRQNKISINPKKYENVLGELLYQFNLKPLLKAEEVNRLAKKYGCEELTMLLFEHFSFLSFTILNNSIGWLNSVNKVNGVFDFAEFQEDYENCNSTKYDCPLLLTLSKIESRSFDFYGAFNTALSFAKENGIIQIDSLIYKQPSKRRTKIFRPDFSDIGFLLYERIVNVTYHRYNQYLSSLSDNISKPITLFGLCGCNTKNYTTFLDYISHLGIDNNSKVSTVSAIIRPAVRAGILSQHVSEDRIFNIIVNHFALALKSTSRPRHGGKKYQSLHKKALAYFGLRE